MVIFRLLENNKDILTSLDNFNRDARDYPDVTKMLFKRIKYWVYDPANNTFGPNKFVGYIDMTCEKYRSALQDKSLGPFHGAQTKKAIERILGRYEPDVSLIKPLIFWAESINPGEIAGVKKEKWNFIYLQR